MSVATVTSKGQTTIPKMIRELLNLHPGDRIDFVVGEDGKVYLQPLNVDVEELSGILNRPGMRPVSVEEMNQAIQLANRGLS
ncbi:AbrB/MazE/SpoVT family DNA-binding domain-containing protein [Anthocerotibacter panamensis]|uniref:AbrB/MazE/SpoVT family DNA-binding domain-containing protein n=1 Tax=Anthocerotibacter panamensis TaxID=2857077 RepID=UPI001C404E63|nr:AbrB/MazE/SpoVT family DNA-binding domain-containing protein [Anthocerotibacter panamensis]